MDQTLKHDAVFPGETSPRQLIMEVDSLTDTRLTVTHDPSQMELPVVLKVSVDDDYFDYPMALEQVIYLRNFLNEYLENLARLAIQRSNTNGT